MRVSVFFILFSILLASTQDTFALNKIYDSANVDAKQFFCRENTKYIIRHHHKYKEEISIPKGSTLYFAGGSISAKITFQNTTLSGKIRLQGSVLGGSIANRIFEASWLCYKDGKRDDAANINNLLDCFDNIHFSKGSYLLQSFHKSLYPVNKPYHLGINRSGIILTGSKGAEFITETKAGTLNIYSKPYDFHNTIHNIKIEGITFKVVNESKIWDDYQQHCHTISMMGVRNCIIKDCSFRNFWGDAICTNHYSDNPQTGERATNDSVLIQHNNIDGYKCCNRNGVSVINGKNIWVKDNNFVNCSDKTMPGAIDIEPNYDFYTCHDIFVENNVIKNCRGNNGAISICIGPSGGIVKNVKIRHNRTYNSSRGLLLYVGNVGYMDSIDISNNYFDENTDPYAFHGSGEMRQFIFAKNTFKCKARERFGGDVKIKKLTSVDNDYAVSLPMLYFYKICSIISDFMKNIGIA